MHTSVIHFLYNISLIYNEKHFQKSAIKMLICFTVLLLFNVSFKPCFNLSRMENQVVHSKVPMDKGHFIVIGGQVAQQPIRELIHNGNFFVGSCSVLLCPGRHLYWVINSQSENDILRPKWDANGNRKGVE